MSTQLGQLSLAIAIDERIVTPSAFTATGTSLATVQGESHPRLTWLTALPAGPSPVPPLEFVTADGVYFTTADGVYFGVFPPLEFVTADGVYFTTADGVYFGVSAFISSTCPTRVDLYPHLHRVFDPDRGPVLALRVRHADGAAWRIAGYNLLITAGQAAWQLDLSQYTIATLAQELTAAGCEIAYLNPDTDHLSALALLEGAGDQDTSNGDHLSLYTAPLTVLLEAWGRALCGGRFAINAALANMVLTQAGDEWADLHGAIFGIPRLGTVAASPYTALATMIGRYLSPCCARPWWGSWDHRAWGCTSAQRWLYAQWETCFGTLLGVAKAPGEAATAYRDRLILAARERATEHLPPLEADAAYTARIVVEVQRERNSPAAISRNILRTVGADVTVREPYKEIHRLSRLGHALSGRYPMQGAPVYEFHTMQLQSADTLTAAAWVAALVQADADRPAGTLMLPPVLES